MSDLALSVLKVIVMLACLFGGVASATFLVLNYGQAGLDGLAYFPVFLEILILVSIAVFFGWAASYLVPTDARNFDWRDPILMRLVGVAIVIFVAAKWVTPFINYYLPYQYWYKDIVAIAAFLLAIAMPRKLNAPLSRLVLRYPDSLDKTPLVFLVASWTFMFCLWISSIQMGAVRSKINIGGVSLGEIPSMNSGFIMPAVLTALALAFWYFSKEQAASKEPIGIINETTRGDLPVMAWSQLVASGETEASEDAKGRYRIYLGVVAVAAVLGLASGSIENMIFWTLVTAWICAFGLRGAGSLRMQGQVLQAAPHTKTEVERREEVTPLKRREDCEAFVEQSGNELWFCIARGDKRNGPLPLVERVPWDSFGNFEEGSHKQWFRARGSVNELADWGVIVAQSNVGRVVCVAESLTDHAWLVELLVRLQNTFIAPRDAMVRTFREAESKRRAHEGPAVPDTDFGSSINKTPIRPF